MISLLSDHLTAPGPDSGNCASRQQVSAVIGVDVKTIYRYCPASEVIVGKK